jgi:phage terminase Nu1 subunit (DNA packaging protein)
MKMSFQTPTPHKKYVETATLAEYFDVSIQTINNWRKRGDIPRSSFIQAGDVYRYNIALIEAHLTSEGEPDGEETISD